MKKLKLFIGLFIIFMFVTSCVSIRQFEQFSMVSNRNFDPNVKYQLLLRYVGASDAELEKSRARTVQEAIDQTVQKVNGGEFLMNAKIYDIRVGGGRYPSHYYAVEGDVWGIPTTP